MAVIFYAIIVAQIYLERKKVRDKKFKRQIIFTYKNIKIPDLKNCFLCFFLFFEISKQKII